MRDEDKCKACHNPIALKADEVYDPSKNYDDQRVKCEVCADEG